jgi:outer membrane scaffolding protein for murein synthesis (MipA/OmpV family)
MADRIMIDQEAIESALSTMRGQAENACDDAKLRAGRMAVRQTSGRQGTKWGAEQPPIYFSNGYQYMMQQLQRQVVLWQEDFDELSSRIKLALAEIQQASDDQSREIASVWAESLFLPPPESEGLGKAVGLRLSASRESE